MDFDGDSFREIQNGREDFKSFIEHFLDEDEVKCDSRSIRSQRIADIYIYIHLQVSFLSYGRVN